MAARRTLILDASALLDGVDASRPEWGETVRDLLARHPCAAPALLAWELGNVVHRKHPEVFGPRRAETLETLLECVDLVPSGAEARRRCGDLVAATGLTFYDAAYLDLARSASEGGLVSQDRRLLAAAREQGVRAWSLDEAARALKSGEL